jgi:hypothetical protein
MFLLTAVKNIWTEIIKRLKIGKNMLLVDRIRSIYFWYAVSNGRLR